MCVCVCEAALTLFGHLKTERDKSLAKIGLRNDLIPNWQCAPDKSSLSVYVYLNKYLNNACVIRV